MNNTNMENHVAVELQRLNAEIERLRAALANVIPIAERYVGRSDGGRVVDSYCDKIWKAKELLTRR